MTRSDRLFIFALVVSDLLWTWISFMSAHYLRFASGWFSAPLGHPSFDQQVGSVIVLSALWLLTFKWCGLYEPRRQISGVDEFYSVLLGVSLGAILFVCAAFLTKATWFSRSVLGIGLAFDLALVTLSRAGLRSLRAMMWNKGFGLRRVVIIGADPVAQAMAQVASRPHLGSTFVGYLIPHTSRTTDERQQESEATPILGSVSDLPDLSQRCDVRDVIVAPNALTDEQVLDLISLCEALRLKIKLMPNHLDLMKLRGESEDFEGAPLINVSEAPLRGWSRLAKRAVDIIVSLVILLLLSPVMVLVALAIKLTSRGPLFFVQERVRDRGRTFRMYKFRTMRVNAHLESNPVWGNPSDPRRTFVGKVLRRMSLDEIPQLFNVLLGEMSLVGPRPEEPYFMHKFRETIPHYMDRHRMKAGLTGWAQVHGLRGNTSVEERTKYDLYYVRNWSMMLDLKILIKTAFEVLFHKHAY